MAYNEKAILKDVNKKPVPQYWNPETQQFEVIESKDGMLRVIMVDSQGREIQTQNLVDQIAAKLDELIQVVSE
ncbi:hypothetical protein [Tepidimicrobium xylanilyticum]|uniref:hypothetical protein n=1 Tax=Tepidimicrobium xylanilyticum TaxID=1123352 RepID=UPI002653FB2B|nr:hypothetical protein [Tepidimicrobium xylanilyticum]GMG96864.1 hypothetical protein EN5CB1_16900 [Tepidimicrobium xylanilyticum]